MPVFSTIFYLKSRNATPEWTVGFFSRGIAKKSILVFDMDNTLVDEFGATARPGMPELLHRLKADYRLFLWTNSMRQRAVEILNEHKLRSMFERCIFREDYDADNKNIRKDLRQVSGKLIIDDDPEEIAYNRRHGIQGYLIPPYRKHHSGKADGEAERILRVILGKA